MEDPPIQCYIDAAKLMLNLGSGTLIGMALYTPELITVGGVAGRYVHFNKMGARMFVPQMYALMEATKGE